MQRTQNTLLAMVAGLIGVLWVGVAAAQTGPSITATPTAQPNTYTVTGAGFEPGVKLKVIEVTCGELPCPAGGGVLVPATPDAAGRFSVTITLNDATAPTGREFRLLAAFPDDRAALATDPQVKVPAQSGGTGETTPPRPPATGNSVLSPYLDESSARPGFPATAALLVLVSIVSLAKVTLRRR